MRRRLQKLQSIGNAPLKTIFLSTVREAEGAIIRDPEFLNLFGFPVGAPCRAGDLWKHLANEVEYKTRFNAETVQALDLIFEKGTLSRRILHAIGANGSRERIEQTYSQLCDCLATGKLFDPE